MAACRESTGVESPQSSSPPGPESNTSCLVRPDLKVELK